MKNRDRRCKQQQKSAWSFSTNHSNGGTDSRSFTMRYSEIFAPFDMERDNIWRFSIERSNPSSRAEDRGSSSPAGSERTLGQNGEEEDIEPGFIPIAPPVAEIAVPLPVTTRISWHGEVRFRKDRPPRNDKLSIMSISDTMSRFHELCFLTTIFLTHLCAQAGITQVLAIMPIIGATWDIHDVSKLTWPIAGYTLTLGTFMLLASRLGEVFGPKQVLLGGLLWSAFWATVAGFSVFTPSSILLIICRVFQGIGPALCIPNAMALLGAAYAPGRRKAVVFSLFAAAAPSGWILGAAGASLLALAWWPAAYWAFAIVLSVMTVGGHLAIPTMRPRQERSPQTLRDLIIDLDLPGATTGITALALLTFALIQAPIVPNGWTQPYIWLALIMGTLLACLFMTIERFYASKPLLPTLSFVTVAVLAAVACGWACVGIWSFYTWQFLGPAIKNLSPLQATAWFSPIVVVGVAACLAAGPLLHKLGPHFILVVSMASLALGATMMATVSTEQTYWRQIFVSMIFIPLGMDLSFPAATLILSDVVDKERKRNLGIAVSLVGAVISYSISVGIGIGFTVEHQVRHDASTTRTDMLRGYRAAFWTGVGLAGLGGIICLGLLFRSYVRTRNRFCRCHGVVEETTVQVGMKL